MARIELRDTVITILDGFGGTAKIDDLSIMGADTTLEIDTLANLTDAVTKVPVGARFTIDTVATTIFTVTAKNDNEQQEVDLGAPSAGTFTLAFNGQTTAGIAFNATAAAVQSALEALSNIAVGDVVVTGTAPTWVVEFRGVYLGVNVSSLVIDGALLTGGTPVLTVLHEGATTWELTFTPALDALDLPANDDNITFLPQRVEIKVGAGNLTYTEAKEYNYELDRGDLDTVREGDEQPLELSIEFVYEHVRTGTNEQISPVDALKGVGGAAGWFSSSSDPCEPYAVDIVIEHITPCGSQQDEITTFPEFRRDSLEFDLSAATISATGRCNASEPTIVRQ